MVSKAGQQDIAVKFGTVPPKAGRLAPMWCAGVCMGVQVCVWVCRCVYGVQVCVWVRGVCMGEQVCVWVCRCVYGVQVWYGMAF